MQQTETYNLNLIETSDTFSPDPLNQNTQKLEAALSAETAQRTAMDAALDSRVTVLETHKVAVGTYIGNHVTAANGQEINLGFYPRVVFVQPASTGVVMATRTYSFGNGAVTITENGFRVDSLYGYNMNGNGGTYLYCAIS